MRNVSHTFTPFLMFGALFSCGEEDLVVESGLPRQGNDPAPKGCVTISFDEVSDLVDSTPEVWEDPSSGMVIRSLYSGGGEHLHFEDGESLRNHSGCCSSPYRFEMGPDFLLWDSFTIRSATFSDVSGDLGTHSFTTSKSGGGPVEFTIDNSTGTVDMSGLDEFSEIEWFQWRVSTDYGGGEGEIDDIVICPGGHNICEDFEQELAHVHQGGAYPNAPVRIEFDTDSNTCRTNKAKDDDEDAVISDTLMQSLMFRLEEEPPSENPGYTQDQQVCAVLNQAYQVCRDGVFEPANKQEQDGAPPNTSSVPQTAVCHPGAEVLCRRQSALEAIPMLDGVEMECRSETESVENFCTSQVPGGRGMGYSLELPSSRPIWECDDDSDWAAVPDIFHRHCCESDSRVISGDLSVDDCLVSGDCNGRNPLGWINWNKNASYDLYGDKGGVNVGGTNLCRFARAITECVLPVLGTPEPCELYQDGGGSGNGGNGPFVATGVRYPDFDGDYCFKIGQIGKTYDGEVPDGSPSGHAQSRAADFNNYSNGPFNYGNLAGCGGSKPPECTDEFRVAQTDIPPKFVSLMEACGFDWGGRFVGASVGLEEENYEGCDPMHFELPALSYEPQVCEDP